MISVNEFKNGLTITVDGELWRVVEFQHVKPGKGSAFVRSKLKNLRTGAVQEKTFRAGEKLNKHKSIVARCSTCMQTATTTSSWILKHTNNLNFQAKN